MMESAWPSANLMMQGEPLPALKGKPREHRDLEPDILRAAQTGDLSAQEQFVLHYQGGIYAFLSRLVGRGSHVDDLAQEVFLRALKALPRYESRGSRLSTWLFQIAVRLVYDERKSRHPFCSPEFSEVVEDHAPGPFELCLQQRKVLALSRLVAELPEEQRIVLLLVAFHGLSLKEVATSVECPVATVKTRLFRARMHLRDGFVSVFGDYP